MKNTASELYTMNHATAYQHAFGYIRQLAILLRNGLKVKSKVRLFSTAVRDTFSVDTAYRKFTNKSITGNLSIVSIFGLLSLLGRATG